jgi:hypothetical protein
MPTWLFSDTDDDLRCIAWKITKSGHLRYGSSILAHRHVSERALNRKLRLGEVVDHINQVKTDNRRENLRVTNASGNAQNRPKRPDAGVAFRGKSWEVYISINGVAHRRGRFSNKEEALAWRDDMIEKHSYIAVVSA